MVSTVTPQFPGLISGLFRGAHGVPTKRIMVATCRLHSDPGVEQTGVSCDDGIARQWALVGDAVYNQRWCDSLSELSSHQYPTKIAVVG